MKLRIYPETCCEICEEVIHNHFDCPECGTKFASTDIYDALYELPKDEQIITCEHCSTQYRLIEGDPYDSNAEWFKMTPA